MFSFVIIFLSWGSWFLSRVLTASLSEGPAVWHDRAWAAAFISSALLAVYNYTPEMRCKLPRYNYLIWMSHGDFTLCHSQDSRGLHGFLTLGRQVGLPIPVAGLHLAPSLVDKPRNDCLNHGFRELWCLTPTTYFCHKVHYLRSCSWSLRVNISVLLRWCWLRTWTQCTKSFLHWQI